MVKLLWIVSALSVVVFGCSRNRPSENPPVHLVQNMDEQPKYKAQAESRFFADGQSMRLPVEGIIARGWLRTDSVVYYTGRHTDGRLAKWSPLEITRELLERGRDRFDIFCSPATAGPERERA